MIAADLKNYVTPVARLEEHIPDEPELEVGTLIDTSASFVEPPAPPPVPALNGVLAEKSVPTPCTSFAYSTRSLHQHLLLLEV